SLVIAADILATQLTNGPVHDRGCLLKSLAELYAIPLGLETRQVVCFETDECLQIPWTERVGEVLRQTLRGAHQDIVEEVIDAAARRKPSGPRNEPCPGFAPALRIRYRVGFGFRVVFATHAGVLRERHR